MNAIFIGERSLAIFWKVTPHPISWSQICPQGVREPLKVSIGF